MTRRIFLILLIAIMFSSLAFATDNEVALDESSPVETTEIVPDESPDATTDDELQTVLPDESVSPDESISPDESVPPQVSTSPDSSTEPEPDATPEPAAAGFDEPTDQSLVLPNNNITTILPEGWSIVTPETAAANAILLGVDADIAKSIMTGDNIIVAAYAPGKDSAIRIREVETEKTKTYFDIERYTQAMRTNIKSDFENDTVWKVTGYKFSEVAWKNTKAAGRYLRMKYIRREDGVIVSRGVMAYTVRNGKEYTIQLQVEGRQVTQNELKLFESVLNNTKYMPALEAPPLPVALSFDSRPLSEVVSGSFKIKGTSTPGATISASLVNLEKEDGAPFKMAEVVAKNTGKFTLDITLPGEGKWNLIIESVKSGYETTTYESTLTHKKGVIPINLTSDLSGEIWAAQPRLAGTTLNGTVVQVTEGGFSASKRATSGEFVVRLDPLKEGERTITVTLSHKDYPDRILTYTFDRKWNVDDEVQYLNSVITKVSYPNLIKGLEKYAGKTVRYYGKVVDVTLIDGNTHVTIDTSAKGDGSAKVVFVAEGDQPFEKSISLYFFGTVTGELQGDAPLIDYIVSVE